MDGRLDKRTYGEFGENITKWETIEEWAINLWARKYEARFGGEVRISDFGFRKKGLEEDVKKIDIEPDFKVFCENGEFANQTILVEVQGMEPDYSQFHIKEHKVKKTIEAKAFFLQVSAIGKQNERFVFLTPEKFNELAKKSFDQFGIVGFPGTVSEDFPKGKPAYRFKDEWFQWIKTR